MIAGSKELPVHRVLDCILSTFCLQFQCVHNPVQPLSETVELYFVGILQNTHSSALEAWSSKTGMSSWSSVLLVKPVLQY
jgi:hypothetical protein